MSPRRYRPSVADGREEHRAWLDLVEVNGPFLALPVLLRVWPTLEAVAPSTREVLRIAHAHHQMDPDPWVEYVLRRLLGWGDALRFIRESMIDGRDFSMVVAEHATRLTPTFILEQPHTGQARLLGMVIKPEAHPTARPSGDAWPATPTDRMAKLCRHHGVELGLITNGRWFAIVWAPRGGVTTTAVFDSATWNEASDLLAVRAFVSLLHRRRFFGVPDTDTLPALLHESVARQEEVTDALGLQLRQAVELLVEAIGRYDIRMRERRGRGLPLSVTARDAYHAAVSVAMRVVFLLFSEERRLLPADNDLYASAYSVGRMCEDLERQARHTSEDDLEHSTTAWQRLIALSNAIHNGVSHPRLSLTAYDGPMFDPDVHPWLADVNLDDRTMLHVLQSVQFVCIKRERRRLSFRALNVEQIGYVYESLLADDGHSALTPMVGLIGKPGRTETVPLNDLERYRAGSAGVDALADALTRAYRHSGIGSLSALVKRLTPQSAAEQTEAMRLLLHATGGDRDLADRLMPFLGLLRRDLLGVPVVIPVGSMYVGRSDARATTGAHYTPPGLAAEIVRATLEPLVYLPGPLQTDDETAWVRRSSKDILDLRIADITVGSGAFLVAACRFLADRLIEAWAAEGDPEAMRFLSPSNGILRPPDAEADPLTIRARRSIIQHCLYGVDINPMAVEIAKLSLWLISMDPAQPFTFLDDRLMVGDALLGITSLDQLEALHLDAGRGRVLQGRWLGDPAKGLRTLIAEVADGRRQLARMPSDSLSTVRAKQQLNAELLAKTAKLRLVADLVTGACLTNAGKSDERLDESLKEAADLARRVAAGVPGAGAAAQHHARQWLSTDVRGSASARLPLHWCLVFADVFEAGGFDAIIGNQPDLGGQKLTGAFGVAYREHLVRWLGRGLRGTADLVAYCVLRAVQLLHQGGQAGIIATNTLAQGDTRQVGLDQVVAAGAVIRRAVKSRPWPSRSSALEVSIIWLSRTAPFPEVKFVLDGQPVRGITPWLEATSRADGVPQRLLANRSIAFQGSIVLGLGFTMSPDEAHALIVKDQRNAEVLFPYLNGEDLSRRPDCSARRWIINFHDWAQERAASYPECFERVILRVKPERARNNRKVYRDYWWHYAEKRPAMVEVIEPLTHVIAITRVSKVVMPVVVPTRQVFSEQLVIFATDNPALLALLSSAPHYWWAIDRASTLETRIRYTPTDVFETLARPGPTEEMRGLGARLDKYRRDSVMLPRHAGLTATYNLVHDPACKDADIAELRRVHIAVDEAVVRAYGWHDLLTAGLDHGFHDTRQGVRHTIGPSVRREILDRLLELNHERHAAEPVAQPTTQRGLF